MATFAGTTADVYTDPASHDPVEDVHLLVYSAATGGSQITDLTDWDGTTLPGYVATDTAGAFRFKTTAAYSIVWVQDPSGHRYQCQSRESVQAGVDAAAAIPGLQADTVAAVDASNASKLLASRAAEDLQFQGMVSGVGSVDARTGIPQQAVQFSTSSGSVIQCLQREQTSGEWYVSHAQTGTAGGRETTVIDRMAADGTLLDTMTLQDAGHGTYIAPQLRDDGNIWIWVPFKIYDTSGNVVSTNLYRIKYRGGVTVTNVVADAPNSVSVVGSSPTTSTQAYLDVSAGRIVVSVNGKYSLYDQSDLEANGLGATKIGTTVPAQPGTIQGAAVAGTTLYRLTGTDNTTNSSADPKLLTAFSLLTGKQLYQRDLTAAVPLGEPEGLNVWRDASGFPTLYMGLSTGPGGARTSYAYSIVASDAAPSGYQDVTRHGVLTTISQDGTIAALNAKLINAALKLGNVYLPPGTIWISDSIRIPSNRSLIGAGIDQTWVKMIDGVASNLPAVTNLGNTNSAHTTPDTNLHVADLSIDGNRGNRNSDTQVNENGCAFRFSCVEHGLVERVHALNGTHSFDAAASVYMDGSLAVTDPNKRPPGPSRWVTFKDCIAGGSDDDAFTTHDSQFITYINCQAINHENKPRDGASNGYEIDDGSQDVMVIDCYAYGFRYGVEVKGHPQNIPARRVGIIGTTAEHCDYGFGIFWDSYATAPDLPSDVWLKGCQSIDNADVMGYDASFGYAYHNAITIGGYTHVTVEDFVARNTLWGNIHIYEGANHIRLRNIIGENVYARPYSTRGFVHAQTDAGDDIQIEGVELRNLSGVASAVSIQATTSVLADDIKSTGTAPAAWKAATAYVFGQQVSLPGGEAMVCVITGTSGSTTPTAPAVNGTVADGSATWRREYSTAVMMSTDTAKIMARRVTQTGYAYGAYVTSGANSGGYAQAPIVTGWWA